MDRHHLQRYSSPEYQNSVKKMNMNIKDKNRKQKLLQGRLQQLAGPLPKNEEVIKAFKSKQPLKGRNFESTGNEFKLFGHVIARHVPNGLEVSNAGYPTSKTYDTLRALGINTRIQKGVTTINDKEIDPNKGDFHFVPSDVISSSKVYFSTPEQREKMKQRNTNKGIIDQRKFREQSRERATGYKTQIPLSQTQIQPHDQKIINNITGVKSPLGQPVRATEQHHILFKEKFPGLKTNPNNAIPMERTEHDELHKLNPMSNYRKIGKLRLKIAGIKELINKKKLDTLKKKKMNSNTMIQTAKHLSADAIISKFKEINPDIVGVNGVFDPIEGRILDANIPRDKVRLQNLYESGDKLLGFNSITDTRTGPNSDLILTQKQLRDIENAGGVPALGFDNGSLEAVRISYGNSDQDILDELLDHQNSTGILDPNTEFRIVPNPKYKQ